MCQKVYISIYKCTYVFLYYVHRYPCVPITVQTCLYVSKSIPIRAQNCPYVFKIIHKMSLTVRKCVSKSFPICPKVSKSGHEYSYVSKNIHKYINIPKDRKGHWWTEKDIYGQKRSHLYRKERTLINRKWHLRIFTGRKGQWTEQDTYGHVNEPLLVTVRLVGG